MPLQSLHTVSGPAIFEQSIQAFRARTSFSVGVALDATINRTTASGRYQLEYQAPGKVLLTKFEDGRPAIKFWLDGTKLIAFDPISNEMVVRKALGSRVVDRVANGVGSLDDPLAAQLSPDNMAAFLNRFRVVQGWTTTTQQGNIALIHAGLVGGKKTRTELDFSASSKLLTRALLTGPDSSLRWEFRYGGKPTKLSFVPPPGTRRVASLAEHVHVNASDAKARALVDQSLRSYSRLTSVAYSVSGPDGPSDNWMSGSSFRVREGRLDWVYSGGMLVLHDGATGTTYRGQCRASAILGYLKALKHPIDPTLQSLILHRNPIKGWFLPNMTVSSKGVVSLNGVASNAVELRSEDLEVSLLIRGDNHLVASVASRGKDTSGKVVFETQREFTYWSVNKPLAKATFAAHGGPYLPLSKLGR